jgi:hypothetical protein
MTVSAGMPSEALILRLVSDAKFGIDAMLYAIEQTVQSRFPDLAMYLPKDFRARIEKASVSAMERTARIIATTDGTQQNHRFQAYTALLGVKAELVFISVEIENALSRATFDEQLWEVIDTAKATFLPILGEIVHVALTSIMATVAAKMGGRPA